MNTRKLIFFIATALSLMVSASANAQWSDIYKIPFPKPSVPPVDTVSVVVIGDVMMHTKQLGYDCSTFLTSLKPMLEGADISIANMEFALGGAPYSGYPAFSAPDSYADYVKSLGVDVFLLANNHIRDKGERGLQRTIDYYEAMDGIRYTGAALSEQKDSTVNPLIMMSHGIRFAFINCTYGTNGNHSEEGFPRVRLTSKELIKKDIDRAREAGADFIIALPHWGLEYQLKHSYAQENLARWLVDQGVDAIVGGHPHVVQDTTHIKGVPVIYSMGNAVSNMTATNTRLELAVTLRFTNDHEGSMKMLEPELTFLWCTVPGMLIDGFKTIPVEKYIGRRDEWITPSDYDNMMSTLARVKGGTGIE
ncbi:MAG: CapA family protein [Bacteroidales bacterium]|nr:CapA family protein [Bacteroidales bacterium]